MNFQKQLQHISRNEGGEGGQRQFGAFHPFLREYAPLNHHPFLYISRKSHNTRAWWVRLLRSSKEIVVALSLLLQLLQQRGHLMPSTPPFTPQLFPLSPNLPPGDRVELNIEVILEIFLSDPGVPGVRSMGPVLSHWVTLCRLNWCDSGWWRYKLNTNW